MTNAETALSLLQGFAVMIVLGVLAARLARMLRIPDIIPLLLAGMAVGPSGLALMSAPTGSIMSQLVLTAGVAFILFEGGLDLSFRDLRPTLVTIALLATVGVGVSAAVAGVAAHLVWGFPPLLALLLGALVAPTDPSALIPLFGQLRVREKCRRTLIAESAFNDATGAILTLTLAGAVAGDASLSTGTMLWEMGRETAIGLGVGLIVGYALVALVVKDAFRVVLGTWVQSSPQLMLLGAIGAYVVATHVGGSGFLAAFVAGLTVEQTGHVPTRHFVEHLSTLFRILIFVSLGSNVDLHVLRANLAFSVPVVLVILGVARPLIVFGSALWDRRARWTLRELLFLCWARPIGVMPAALLGLIAAQHVPGYDQIYSVTFLAIGATILGQAATAGWLARKLDLIEAPETVGSRATLLDALLVDRNYSILEIGAPAELVGKTLAEADLRARYGVSVLVIKRADGVEIVPDPTRRIGAEDVLVVIGEAGSLRRIV